jgi:MoxR-like ATPase
MTESRARRVRPARTTPGVTAAAGANGSSAAKSGAGKAGSSELIRNRADFQRNFNAIVDNVERVIKGKDEVVRMLLVAMLAEGHVLLEDVPGTGKTMMARAVAQSINANINRTQCTPDLLPSDITGTSVFDQSTSTFSFREGPVFANILLADEINRATPKTQSALLEAMQERRVSVDNKTHKLPSPFLVLATQNPIELAGTFQLPEAQLDRFMIKLSVGYASRDDEVGILRTNQVSEAIDELEPIVDLDVVQAMIRWAKGVSISDAVLYYIVDLCSATRTDPALGMGASSRASQALMKAARVVAASQGREDVLPDDVTPLVPYALAHRVVLNPEAVLRGETIHNVIDRILAKVRMPVDVSSRDLGAVADVREQAAGA